MARRTGDSLSSSPGHCWGLFCLLPRKNSRRDQTQAERWKHVSLLKWQYLPVIWEQVSSRDSWHPGGFSFCLLLTVVYQGMEYLLLGEEISREPCFTLFPFTWSGSLAIFVLAPAWFHSPFCGFALGELPGQISNFANSRAWLLLCWPPGIRLKPNCLSNNKGNRLYWFEVIFFFLVKYQHSLLIWVLI